MPGITHAGKHIRPSPVLPQLSSHYSLQPPCQHFGIDSDLVFHYHHNVMNLLYSLLVGSLVTGSALAKEYVLDKKDYVPPNLELSLERKMTMKNGVLTVNAGGQVMNGTMDMENSESLTKTFGVNTLTTKVTKSSEKQTMVMNGQKIDQPAKQNPLLNVAVAFSKNDATWKVDTNTDNFTELQKAGVKKELKELNRENTMYGYEARKVGETWKIDPKLATSFFDSKDPKGELKVTLVGIEKKNGLECAKCKYIFDVTGSMDDGATMNMKGEMISYRSLKHLVDVDLSGTMNVTISKKDAQMTMTMKAAATMNEATNIKEMAVK